MLSLFALIPTESSLEGNSGNVGEIRGSMKKVEICRKESVMKMMVEHHFDVIPKGLIFYFFSTA